MNRHQKRTSLVPSVLFSGNQRGLPLWHMPYTRSRAGPQAAHRDAHLLGIMYPADTRSSKRSMAFLIESRSTWHIQVCLSFQPRAASWQNKQQSQNDHRVLKRATWSSCAFRDQLLHLLSGPCGPEPGRDHGMASWSKGCPKASTATRCVRARRCSKTRGLRWMSMMLLTLIPVQHPGST